MTTNNIAITTLHEDDAGGLYIRDAYGRTHNNLEHVDTTFAEDAAYYASEPTVVSNCTCDVCAGNLDTLDLTEDEHMRRIAEYHDGEVTVVASPAFVGVFEPRAGTAGRIYLGLD